ncbi:MAG: hypothetical protein ACP5Q4_08280 [Candidatus Caldatribacteriaceae bacterium]
MGNNRKRVFSLPWVFTRNLGVLVRHRSTGVSFLTHGFPLKGQRGVVKKSGQKTRATEARLSGPGFAEFYL